MYFIVCLSLELQQPLYCLNRHFSKSVNAFKSPTTTSFLYTRLPHRLPLTISSATTTHTASIAIFLNQSVNGFKSPSTTSFLHTKLPHRLPLTISSATTTHTAIFLNQQTTSFLYTKLPHRLHLTFLVLQHYLYCLNRHFS